MFCYDKLCRVARVGLPARLPCLFGAPLVLRADFVRPESVGTLKGVLALTALGREPSRRKSRKSGGDTDREVTGLGRRYRPKEGKQRRRARPDIELQSGSDCAWRAKSTSPRSSTIEPSMLI